LADYPVSFYICDKDGDAMRTVLGPDDCRCAPVSLAAAGEWLPKALIAAEDKRFYRHGGVDMIAVARAVVLDVVCRRIVSGASTISTQVIRMSNPRQRTFATKAIEAVTAIQMEQRLSKSEILEQYLNRMPVGGNLVGMQAGARRYFGKDAADLSLGEAALLAGLPQSPARFRPDRYLKRALKRRAFVLERMQALGFVDAAERERAERQTMNVMPHADAFRAPHFCELVKQKLNAGAVAIDKFKVTTTLDSSLQSIAEDVLASYRQHLAGKLVYGGAVVIIDVASGDVLAMVGSPDYDDEKHAGRVNCAVMRRSPGSALKPFAYAMGFDCGMITPGSVLQDRPLYFKEYTPRNFDYKFRGAVTARTALIDSLNIPALSLVNRLGMNSFVAELHRLGLVSLDKAVSGYGLSLVLGTGEVKLLNLSNAYACLARGGIYKPYRLWAGQAGAGARVFSAGAAWLVTDVLSGPGRAMAAVGHAGDVVMPRVAWKTGTSSGGRDAWTIGYNPEYVVGVWLGNASGVRGQELTGIGDAAPIVMDVFRQIYPAGRAPWFERPESVAVRKVCAVSGRPVGQQCVDAVDDFYLRGVSDPGLCHKKHNGQRELEGHPLQIVKPLDGDVFVMSDDIAADSQRIMLKATSDDARLFWFVDGRFLAGNASSQWQLVRGQHEIVCSDEHGRSAAVQIMVE
jgi:penicillin-binding protein 1C